MFTGVQMPRSEHCRGCSDSRRHPRDIRCKPKIQRAIADIARVNDLSGSVLTLRNHERTDSGLR